ncbi:hypothetical protein [Oceaniferula spumae]|uniref:hypothetical protein n=1 Tax=Oceaniferula spumae TaxID=2979115 RepID=UPI003F4EB9CC
MAEQGASSDAIPFVVRGTCRAKDINGANLFYTARLSSTLDKNKKPMKTAILILMFALPIAIFAADEKVEGETSVKVLANVKGDAVVFTIISPQYPHRTKIEDLWPTSDIEILHSARLVGPSLNVPVTRSTPQATFTIPKSMLKGLTLNLVLRTSARSEALTNKNRKERQINLEGLVNESRAKK